MLKHQELINTLTTEQKIALLVDKREQGGKVIGEGSVPHLNMADLWSVNRAPDGNALFPAPDELANSADPALFGEVAEQLAAIGAQQGINLFLLPDTKAATYIYGSQISEDPRVSGTMVSAAVRALEKCGVGVCMHAPVPTKRDVAFLGGEVDVRMLYDRMAVPFRGAVGSTPCHAVLLPNDAAEGQYAIVGNVMTKDAVSHKTARLCVGTDHDTVIGALLEGKILLGGSPEPIASAVENYHRIRRSVEEGGATVTELQTALAEGIAISDDMLDSALSERFELAFACNRTESEGLPTSGFAMPDTATITKEEWIAKRAGEQARIALAAARESVVLLKNTERALPLAKNARVAILGDAVGENEESAFVGFTAALCAALEKSGRQIVGTAKGYHLERDRSEELIDEAVALAKNADTVLLFVGLGERRRAALDKSCRLQLPANQQALVEALLALDKKIVAVIAGGRPVACSFDKHVAATLLMPARGYMAATALCDVLTGHYNPSGRLAFAGQDIPDTEFRENQARVRAGVKKTGPFIGYRYHDSEGLTVKYPFGHGLCFTEIEYQSLAVSQSTVHVTLHNRGRAAATETVQLYVGKKDSAVLRPHMELKAMARVQLAAGERRTVDVRLGGLGIYDYGSRAMLTEGGEYQLYAAPSAGDVRLSAKISVAGKSLAPQSFELSEYLHAASDIRTQRYTMEASCEPMKKKSTLFATGIWLILLTLFADVIFAICSLLVGFSLTDYLLPFGVVNAGCLLGGAASLFVYWQDLKKAAVLQMQRERAATEALFRDTERVNVGAVEELFEEEFDLHLEGGETAVTEAVADDESLYAFMSLETDLPTLSTELARFFAERGMPLSPTLARGVLSAVLTSRLLVVRVPEAGMFERFAVLLSQFFATDPYIDSMAGREAGDADLLLRMGASGLVETNLLHAIYAAHNQRTKVHFATLSAVKTESVGEMMMPYIRYFGNPKADATVKAGDRVLPMPPNLWFLLGIDAGESLDAMPAFVSNFATVVDVMAEWGQPAAQQNPVTPIGCPEIEALVYRAKKVSEIPEDLWKAVDRLEEFVNQHTPYHLGNKICLQLESYLAVYAGCGGNLHEAMDSAVAARLLPAILANLKGRLTAGDADLCQTVETIFGEEHAQQCRHLIKNAVLALREPTAAEIPAAVATPLTSTAKVYGEVPLVKEAEPIASNGYGFAQAESSIPAANGFAPVNGGFTPIDGGFVDTTPAPAPEASGFAPVGGGFTPIDGGFTPIDGIADTAPHTDPGAVPTNQEGDGGYAQ